MADMLVNLMTLPPVEPVIEQLDAQGIHIRRPIAPDKLRIVDWVKEHSGPSAAGEMDVCFGHYPPSCFIATQHGDMVGYACYNATAKDFFGPTRVLDKLQGKGVGRALLLKCLWALREEGYAYAIIGGVGPAAFYEKCVGAQMIPGSTPGVYKDFLVALKKGIMGVEIEE